MNSLMGCCADCPFDVLDGFFTSNPIHPEKRWPGTKWRQIKGKFILAADDTHPAGSTGGSSTHTHDISGNAAIGVIQNTTAYDSAGAKLSDEFPTSLFAHTHEYDSVFDRNNAFYSAVSCVKVKGSANEQSNTPPILQCASGKEPRSIVEIRGVAV